MSEDKNLILVCNGEIYNFKELRNELKKKYNFKTNLDTEVLIPGYLEWGDKLWKKLNGMFSFAIWDKKNHNLTLARDRLGEKPLYYGFNEGIFFFGSELKAFKFHPSFKPEIDNNSLGSL